MALATFTLCGGVSKSLCAVGVMFPPALSVRARDGAAFLNPEGKKMLLLTDTGVYSRSVPMHRLLLPQLLGYLSKLCYKHSTNGESEGMGRGVPSGALSLVCSA